MHVLRTLVRIVLQFMQALCLLAAFIGGVILLISWLNNDAITDIDETIAFVIITAVFSVAFSPMLWSSYRKGPTPRAAPATQPYATAAPPAGGQPPAGYAAPGSPVAPAPPQPAYQQPAYQQPVHQPEPTYQAPSGYQPQTGVYGTPASGPASQSVSPAAAPSEPAGGRHGASGYSYPPAGTDTDPPAPRWQSPSQ